MVSKYRILSLSLLAVFMTVVLFWNGYLYAESPDVHVSPESGTELTVYNNDLALVKDRRILELPTGTGTVIFTDVAAGIDPTSVSFRALNASDIQVLEQNFVYDIINDTKLLQKFLGQKISLTTQKGDIRTGYLLSSGDNIILADRPDGGALEVIKASQIISISFPEIPNGLVIRPELVWLLSNPGKPGPQPVEVTYLTNGLSWRSNYVVTVNQNDDQVDLIGWVTLNNQSGVDYRDSRLKLVAGDIHRASQETAEVKTNGKSINFDKSNSEFAEQTFFEYHLYTLNRVTTLLNNQLKQVELLSAANIQAVKSYIYESAIDPNKIRVMLEFKNSKENHLGIPLPKGLMRIQKADNTGSLQLIGEDQVDHTPQDEKITINLGNTFDVVGERIQTSQKDLGMNTYKESYKITIRNHKKENITTMVIENMDYPEWEIVNSDHAYVKTGSNKVEYSVSVPADGTATINYAVRHKQN